MLKAISYLRKIKPDLIHLNSTCLFAFSIAAKILRIPVICHVREPIRPGLAGWPLRFFSKFSVNGFIGISKFDLASLGVIPKKCNSKVIYNFVEKFKIKKTFEPGLFRKKLGIADNDVVFLYLARFSKSNGWMQLIAMAEKVVEDYPQAKFVLAGATEDIHFNHSKNNIFIVPFEKEIDDYLIGSDIFVCPFVLPHFARGIIEAAAFSLPSLGNNIDGVNELINDNVTGFLYKNKSDFYEKAVRLIKNKDLRNKLGEKAYIKAQTDFNIYNNLKETYAFYDEVVEI
ncbi:hypothetical protein BV902_02230 [Sphingobacterium sp. B29]|uniref:glycosyltransferase family 4 protein n=1 Tax=Sphingobacterium sp. B29 TaxID=1933220 RepID=UPI00095807EC|nr:glycosyltransferase family 4 protein [Sphingobacterium sp. B29]APU95294.1 hypothetical protein BV902_02230 [Sphingobacterium sp. B29]